MITQATKAALKQWAPRHLLAIESFGRNGLKTPSLRLARETIMDAVKCDAEGVNELTDKEFRSAMEAVDEIDDLLKKQKSNQAVAARTARPVAGQENNFGLSSGSSGPVFKDMAGNVIKTYRHDEPIATTGGSDDYGLGSIVKAAVTGDWSHLPANVKAGSAGIGPSGGFLVPSPLANWYVDLARAHSRVLEAGAMTVPMPSGNLSIATVLTDPTPGWKAENANFATSQGSYGQIVLSTHTLGVVVPVSLELIMTATNLDALLQSQLTKRLALVLDTAAIAGDGTQNTPKGILNNVGGGVGVAQVPVGAKLTAATAYGWWSTAIGNVLAANAEPGNLSILHNSDVATALDGLVDTLYQPLRPTPAFKAIADRGAVYIANGIVTAAKGIPTAPNADTNPNTTSVVGDFSSVILGIQQSLMLEISREGSYVNADSTVGHAFGQGQVLIRALMMVDVAVQRPNWFAAVTDIRI